MRGRLQDFTTEADDDRTHNLISLTSFYVNIRIRSLDKFYVNNYIDRT